jgi:hypothetical protein
MVGELKLSYLSLDCCAACCYGRRKINCSMLSHLTLQKWYGIQDDLGFEAHVPLRNSDSSHICSECGILPRIRPVAAVIIGRLQRRMEGLKSPTS